MRGPHRQTLWSAQVKRAPAADYRRERWETLDDDFIDVDFVDGPERAPLVLALHGLEGSSRSRYLRRLMALLRRLGWRGAVLHHRGCGGEPNRQLPAYHSGRTDDLDFAVRRLTAGPAGRRPLFIVGYSLGGNVLAKWLGEMAERVPAAVRAACAVSAPYDLARSARAMDRGLSQLIYIQNFLLSLKAKTRAKARRFPGTVDVRRMAHARTLREFDDVVTACLFGFAGADGYYAEASARPWLRRIRVPTLLLNARDDPLVPPAALPTADEVSPAVRRHWTAHGGHLGFVHRDDPWWLERQVVRWFAAALRGG